MVDKVYHYIEKNQMIEEDAGIVAGISGGADSICMLDLLLRIQKRIPMKLYVVHVNHGIRGIEAKQDADFVRQLCIEHELPFILKEIDVPSYAKKKGITMEEAGRILRYEVFQSVKNEYHASKIAVAHHMNDQAETVLFHLFRGTGIRGMGGITPIRDDIIRPLLCVTRSEVETYLEENKLKFRTDQTNFDNCYTRNQIRNQILPIIKQDMQEKVIEHIAHTALLFQEAEQYLCKQAEKIVENEVIFMKEKCEIPIDVLKKQEDIIKSYIIRACLEKICNGSKDLSAQHLKSICGLIDSDVGKSVDLPASRKAKRSYDTISIFTWNEMQTKYSFFEPVTLGIPGKYRIDEDSFIELKLENYEKNRNIDAKTYTKCFDYDKIKTSLLLRNRSKGDYFSVNQNDDHQTVKSYCINQKIPKEDRDSLLLIADDTHVLWIIGYRISEYYKVSEKTKRILRIQVYGGRYNE